MDDILASIRRIMMDEQTRLQESGPAVPPSAAASLRGPARPAAETIVILDASMAVEEMPVETLPAAITFPALPDAPPAMPADAHEEPPMAAELLPPDAALVDVAMPVAQEAEASPQSTIAGAAGGDAAMTAGEHVLVTTQTIEALLAPAAAAAAAASVDALLKQLDAERLALLRPDAPPRSPTIDEVVRSELRPLLKAWLDEHLPPLVERLVRAEINRLIGRSGL